MDRIALIVVPFGICTVVSVLLPFCLIFQLPIIKDGFDAISRRFCNGLSLVNACEWYFFP